MANNSMYNPADNLFESGQQVPVQQADGSITTGAQNVGPKAVQDQYGGPGSDPTDREDLMNAIASRRGGPQMDAAQAGATNVGPASQIGATGQIQAGQIAGPGMNALGAMAQGQVSPAMQAQHDRMLRSIAAQQAGARGSQNVGLASRGAQTAMGQAGAELAGQAGQLQMQAAQAQAGLSAQQAEMGQRASEQQVGLEQERELQQARLEQETTVLQAQLQQQLNLSNAEMENLANKANMEVEAQLQIEADKRMNELMRMGVDEEIARMQAEEEAWKYKSDLMYRYWAAEAQDRLGRDIAVLGDTSTTWWWDDDPEDIMGTASGRGEKVEKYPAGDVGEKLEYYGGDRGELLESMDSVPSLGSENNFDYTYDPTSETPGRQDLLKGMKVDPREAMATEVSIGEDKLRGEQALRQEAVKDTQDTLANIGTAYKWGRLATDVLGGTKRQAKERLIGQGRSEAEGAVAEGLSNTALGSWAGPIVSGTSALADVAMSDDPSMDKGDAAAYALRQTAAGTGGQILGKIAGSSVGGAIGGSMGGPYGAAVGGGIGGQIGGMAGAKGMQALDTSLFGTPAPKKIHSGQFGAAPTHTIDSIHDAKRSSQVGVGEKLEAQPKYGGKNTNLAELEMLRKRLKRG